MTTRSPRDAEDDTGRPEPVLKAVIVPVVTAIAGLVVAFAGKFTPEQKSAVLACAGALAAVLTVAAAAWARSRVTPLADPRDEQGRRLVAAPRGPARG